MIHLNKIIINTFIIVNNYCKYTYNNCPKNKNNLYLFIILFGPGNTILAYE